MKTPARRRPPNDVRDEKGEVAGWEIDILRTAHIALEHVIHGLDPWNSRPRLRCPRLGGPSVKPGG